METSENERKNSLKRRGDRGQRGSALVIAVFVLILISVFVAMALSRTSTEAAAIGNETTEGRTFYAAQGSLEMMTRNFNKVFEVKLNPSNDDLNAVRTGVEPGLTPRFAFTREVDRTLESRPVVLSDRAYAGLYAIRDNWRLRTTATDSTTDVQVQLTRNVFNNRIPIFQFGIFYNDDLELYRPPRFSFGGRVHSNRNFFISPGAEGVYFDSRVTASKHIVTQTWRNGNQSDINNNQTFIKNASRVDRQLLPTQGSVLNTTSGAGDNVFTAADEADLPPSKLNPSWLTQSAIFDGNLQSLVPTLRLPLNVGSNRDLVEMVKRGLEVADADGGDLFRNNAGNLAAVTAADDDDDILRAERFANKTGIRVSLADSKAKLPGCASGVGTDAIPGACGVRLDGHENGTTDALLGLPQLPPNLRLVTRGYQPKAMRTTPGGAFDYVPTRVNGERLHTGGTREVWIKIETVRTDPANGAIITRDITQDILSLGVTEQATEIRDASNAVKFKITAAGYNDTAPDNSQITATAAQTAPSGTDSRSVIKLQRFIIPGTTIPNGTYLKSYATAGGYNAVVRYGGVDNDVETLGGCFIGCTDAGENLDPNGSMERWGHLKRATVDGVTDKAIVPFPIQMFDTREGLYYDEQSTTYYSYFPNQITRNGVMSMIDIDVRNLRRFLRGDFNGLFPTDTPFAIAKTGNVGLENTDIPERSGWVLYVSDRRGDADFDGEFDMEDIFGAAPGNNGTRDTGEDVNRNGILDTSYGTEAERYRDETAIPDFVAVDDHKYYRRGVRLINGQTLPGIYDSATPANTRGFTVASENGIYVLGNYNATGVGSVPATGNTPFTDYLPSNTPTHIPASIVADAVTILSNNWNDAKSFASPYNEGGRLATTTTMRFAMIAGDTIATIQSAPNQGGLSPKLNGGVHNFKRFLERWTGNRLDYSGSLINLFNSRNNNGSFKCCDTVYDPPFRNWVFDSTFLDPSRLPPGTPFFQYVQTTGFQRTND